MANDSQVALRILAPIRWVVGGKQLGVYGSVVAVALTSLVSTACQKDTQKCDEAIATARKAIEMKDFESARKWREHTWKMCGDRAMIDGLDKDILAAEAAQNQAIEEAQKKMAEAAQQQINAAQKLWLKYDEFEDKDKTEENLKKILERANKLGEPLDEAYKAQIEAYNKTQFKTRYEAMKKK